MPLTNRVHRQRPLPDRNLASQWNRVEVLRDPAFWLNDSIAEVNRLAGLETGWDGTDSVAPLPRVLELVRRVVSAAAQIPALPPPHIGPVPGGGVQLEWHLGSKDLELEILPDTGIVFVSSSDGEQDSGLLTFERVENARVLMAWLTH